MPCRVLTLPLLTGLLGVAASAQTGAAEKPEPPPLGEPAPVPDGAPPHLALIDRGDLRAHASWLADDERRGRFTGSTGQLATAEYVAACFKKLGLRPLGDKKGFLQHYPIERTSLEAGTWLRFGDVEIADGFAVLPTGPRERLALNGTFAFCGIGTGEDLPNLARKIPIVLLHQLTGGASPGNDLRAIQRYQAIADALAKSGAEAGVVCLLAHDNSVCQTLTYKALLPDHPQLRFGRDSSGARTRIPLFVIGRTPSLQLLQHVGITLGEDGAPITSTFDADAAGALAIRVATDDKAEACNVVAVLPGRTKKAEAVVFSAHHDHIGYRLDGDPFNGADDNGSGTAGLLEIAEAFAKGGKRPARSIVFLSVSAEELGLWGSAWFAEHPAWPLERIVADVNIDMIGRAGGDDSHIAMQVTPSHEHQQYSTMVRDAVALAANFGIALSSGDTYYRRSDHFNFAQKGVPVVFFCDGEHPDYHQVGDHADKLRYDRMEAIARLAFWTGWQVAEQKGRPERLGSQAAW